ncbi:hypothetical protein A2415_01220 [candidate division WWE3 bacterium RIFOXYC1_FULL_39_7]|uniref:Uncharacterized protein n=1 Tax=candidate division WWE3 bacterium RIFOXYC1_FULL_39_7 TaxID=1802643 RepID=A0A1F4WLZ1_UNCKA|nr:MAG: hypothetical protein A2415_01220 [candidate division WWE3 bacterium RIFOXYC1_FULL_39_7]
MDTDGVVKVAGTLRVGPLKSRRLLLDKIREMGKMTGEQALQFEKESRLYIGPGWNAVDFMFELVSLGELSYNQETKEFSPVLDAKVARLPNRGEDIQKWEDALDETVFEYILEIGYPVTSYQVYRGLQERGELVSRGDVGESVSRLAERARIFDAKTPSYFTFK